MTEETANFEESVDVTADPKDAMKAEYIAYVNEITKGRFSCDTRQEAIDGINAICKVLGLTTVVPKTDIQTRDGQRTPIIVGGTNIDLVKSQYPGLYPVLVERVLELAIKL